MENKSKARVVGNVVIKTMLIGAFLGGWAGLLLTGNKWAYTPAIISLVFVSVGTFIAWRSSKSTSNRSIWIGFGAGFLLLLTSSCLGGFFIIAQAGSTGAGLTAVVIVFELLGGLIGAFIFLILGIVVGLIQAFRPEKPALEQSDV